jgi:glycosyltransferase involved in cell wall biosynthesis
VHQLSRALAVGSDEISAFTSSWKDRPRPEAIADLGSVRVRDARVPVRLLNLAWHSLGWPPVEWLTGTSFDVVHSPHPLLLPSRDAAQVVTVHDLDFLCNPDRVRAEIRRDYPRLVGEHVGRADRVVVPSEHTAAEVRRLLGVAPDRISVCPEGSPPWPAVPPGSVGGDRAGYILFVGTLEARKNLPGLLEAFLILVRRRRAAPRLVLAGKAPPEAASLLARLARPPFAGRVVYRGYVRPEDRLALYQGAAMLVLPSFEEGFGLPVLEAMALGIPVVASNRGALPEVVGDAGLLVGPDDWEALADAMDRVLSDVEYVTRAATAGATRARLFSWERCATLTRAAYDKAVEARHVRSG